MSHWEFHWQRDAITPSLLQDVGFITLEWAIIDHQITEALQPFWRQDRHEQIMPRSFSRRAKHLKTYVDTLFAKEPEEWLLFRWYLQRLKEANGKRDAIAHGQPGMVTKNGRTYPALMVPFPGKDTDFVPMSADDISGLVTKIMNLSAETNAVSAALITALNAASPNKYFSQVRGKWTQLTWENRSPKMPKTVPPPPTFQG